jgi:hypothetical protein
VVTLTKRPSKAEEYFRCQPQACMSELKQDRPLSMSQMAMRSFFGILRKLLPAPKRRHSPRGPDRELENKLTQDLRFMFRDWAARIVHSEIGTVEVECGQVRLRAMREREFLVFSIAPRDTEDWNNPDIVLAGVTGEKDTAIMSDRTSLLSLARALEPRMAQLQSAFSNANLPATQRAIDIVRQAAEERFRTNPRTIGEI